MSHRRCSFWHQEWECHQAQAARDALPRATPPVDFLTLLPCTSPECAASVPQPAAEGGGVGGEVADTAGAGEQDPQFTSGLSYRQMRRRKKGMRQLRRPSDEGGDAGGGTDAICGVPQSVVFATLSFVAIVGVGAVWMWLA